MSERFAHTAVCIASHRNVASSVVNRSVSQFHAFYLSQQWYFYTVIHIIVIIIYFLSISNLELEKGYNATLWYPRIKRINFFISVATSDEGSL